MKKVGRNDPCPCGSGKKFKKCCERTMLGKRFRVTKIEAPKTTQDAPENKAMSGFFQKNVTPIAPTKKEKPSSLKEKGVQKKEKESQPNLFEKKDDEENPPS